MLNVEEKVRGATREFLRGEGDTNFGLLYNTELIFVCSKVPKSLREGGERGAKTRVNPPPLVAPMLVTKV